MELFGSKLLKKAFLHVLIILGAFQFPILGEAITCYQCYDEIFLPEEYKTHGDCWIVGGIPTSNDPVKYPVNVTCNATLHLTDCCLLKMTLKDKDLAVMNKGCVDKDLFAQFQTASDAEVTKPQDCYVMNKAIYEYYKAIAKGGMSGTTPGNTEEETVAYCWCMGDKCNDQLADSHFQAANLNDPDKLQAKGSSTVRKNLFQWTALQLLVVKILKIRIDWFWNSSGI